MKSYERAIARAFFFGCALGSAACSWFLPTERHKNHLTEEPPPAPSVCRATAPDSCVEPCDQDDVRACRILAATLAERDPFGAAELLDRACAGGDASACDGLGRAYAPSCPPRQSCVTTGSGRVVPTDSAKSVRYYERGCALRHEGSCRALAALGKGALITPPGGSTRAEPERVKAKAAAGAEAVAPAAAADADAWLGPAPRCTFGELADCVLRCAEQDGPSCANLGAMEELGQGVPPNVAAALRHYDAGCMLGAEPACRNAAHAREFGAVSRAD